MLSEVESAHSKKWEVGSAELKPTGLGFARTSAKPPSLAPRSLRNLKSASTESGRKYIARYTCQISSANLAEIP